MGGQFRLFQNNRRIHVADLETLRDGKLPNPFQQDQAGDPPIGGIRVRELPADVALADGAENGVADGMDQDVGIRMAQKPLFVRDLLPTQNKPSSHREAVAVIAETDSHSTLPHTRINPSYPLPFFPA